MLRQITLTALLTVTAACSGGSSGAPAGAAPSPSQQTRRDANIITRAEIEQATWATNAFDLVQRLRPSFMRASGTTGVSGAPRTAMVRLNDQDMGDFGALRQIQPSSVQEIRYYSAPDATAKFGGLRGRPVIHVTTR
ncbi:MAG TPA: hypothetical protein VGQ52_12485 [Gemmatimonadaceae bacterium]|jgi:hypothetical protein|nr:hypothetical protein [Gemmatimonadaceae bacterium]